MLKGILFVVFIIITFDIGVSLIEYFEEEPEELDESLEKQEVRKGTGTGQNEEAQVQGESQLDLSLPENLEFDEKESPEQATMDSEKSLDIEFGKKDKKNNGISAKPLIDFEQGKDPELDGARLEWKKEF